MEKDRRYPVLNKVDARESGELILMGTDEGVAHSENLDGAVDGAAPGSKLGSRPYI